MFLFSLTNGFVTTTLMYLGPRKTNDPEIRDLINYINSFIMSLGIDFGIIFAIFFASN